MKSFPLLMATVIILLNSACKGDIESCDDASLKDRSSCEKPGLIAGKTCVWMVDSCLEKSQELAKFMQANMSFSSNLKDKVDSYGTGHGESMDWGKLCGKDPSTVGLNHLVKSITFSFKKDSDKVDVILDCNDTNKTYNLSYKALSLTKALRLELNANGQSVMSMTSNKKDINQLDFFTKGYWFYFPADNVIKGTSLLHNVGFSSNAAIDINTEQDINDVMDYVKKDEWNAAKGAGAITLILNKI